LTHLTHVGSRCNARFFITLRGKEAAGRPEARRRFGYGTLNLFDHKSEPVIDSDFESGNMLAAFAKSWGGLADTSWSRLGQKNRI